jgi:hypothetical protein
MEFGSAFDDIVDHPIMGREWHVPPRLFLRFVYMTEEMIVSFVPALPDLVRK